jgi:hypothetical protein
VIAGTAAVIHAATTPVVEYHYYSTLPCTATVIVAAGTTYYRCESSWYTQAYAGGGMTYVLVAPPPGY